MVGIVGWIVCDIVDEEWSNWLEWFWVFLGFIVIGVRGFDFICEVCCLVW